MPVPNHHFTEIDFQSDVEWAPPVTLVDLQGGVVG